MRLYKKTYIVFLVHMLKKTPIGGSLATKRTHSCSNRPEKKQRGKLGYLISRFKLA